MSVESITRIRLKHFTAFEDLDLRPSPGINVLTGINGTGKTHLMKVIYASCEASNDVAFARKLQGVFMPWQGRIGRMVRRRKGGGLTNIRVERGDRYIQASFTSRTSSPGSAVVRVRGWKDEPVYSAYIPVKEMLANASGFVSLYDRRQLHFEEVYRDIIELASVPPYRGAPDAVRQRLLRQLRDCLGGGVTQQQEEYFLRSLQPGKHPRPLMRKEVPAFPHRWGRTSMQARKAIWNSPCLRKA